MVLLALAFVGLAVATVVLAGPWTVVVAYVVCAGALTFMARKAFPRRVALPSTAKQQSRSARRSGNPAVKSANTKSRRNGPDRP